MKLKHHTFWASAWAGDEFSTYARVTSPLLSVGCEVKVHINTGTRMERLSLDMSCRMYDVPDLTYSEAHLILPGIDWICKKNSFLGPVRTTWKCFNICCLQLLILVINLEGHICFLFRFWIWTSVYVVSVFFVVTLLTRQFPILWNYNWTSFLHSYASYGFPKFCVDVHILGRVQTLLLCIGLCSKSCLSVSVWTNYIFIIFLCISLSFLRNTWLLNSMYGSNRSLNISKVNLTHPTRPVTRATVKATPTTSSSPSPSSGLGMTLRSADRVTRYHTGRQ